MVWGIASVIRRSSRSSSRSFFSALFRSSMSVLLPNHLTTLPSASSWNDTYEEPSVLTVISPDASFQFTWFAGIHQGEPFTNEPIQVIGVNDHLPTPTFPLLQGETGVLVPAFVQYSLDPSGKLVHKKDGTVSMTVWSRAASWTSFSKASLSSGLSHFGPAHSCSLSPRGVRPILAISNPEPKASFSRPC